MVNGMADWEVIDNREWWGMRGWDSGKSFNSLRWRFWLGDSPTVTGCEFGVRTVTALMRNKVSLRQYFHPWHLNDHVFQLSQWINGHRLEIDWVEMESSTIDNWPSEWIRNDQLFNVTFLSFCLSLVWKMCKAEIICSYLTPITGFTN